MKLRPKFKNVLAYENYLSFRERLIQIQTKDLELTRALLACHTVAKMVAEDPDCCRETRKEADDWIKDHQKPKTES